MLAVRNFDSPMRSCPDRRNTRLLPSRRRDYPSSSYACVTLSGRHLLRRHTFALTVGGISIAKNYVVGGTRHENDFRNLSFSG